MRYIGDYAFYNITALKEIEIPGIVTGIGENAFFLSLGSDAAKKRKIYCPGNSSKPNGWNENWANGIPVENIKWNESMPTS